MMKTRTPDGWERLAEFKRVGTLEGSVSNWSVRVN